MGCVENAMSHFSAITLKQLRGLATIVTSGGATAAAESLGLTAPAVSTQLRALESNVGSPLMTRDGGKLALTPEGRELLEAARRIELVLSDCERRLNALAAGHAGLVVLGVVSTAKYFAPRLVALARKELPGVEIVLKIGNREATIAALEDGEVDLAIMGRPPGAPRVDAVPLGPHPHVLIAPPQHALVGRRGVTSDDLLAETFLLRERGSGTRLLVERYLDQAGQGRDYASVEFGTNETIKQGVMAGLGVALISGHTVVAELESRRLALIKAPGLPILRQWFLVRPKALAATAAAGFVARFITERRSHYLPDLDAVVARRAPIGSGRRPR